MIESFRCKETRKIWSRKFSKKFPPDIQGRARRKLIAIDISTSLNDLKMPPSLGASQMTNKLIPLEHPGIFLKEEFMAPSEVSAYRVSKDTNISNMAISEIVRGKRSITPRVGIRLSKYFGVSEGYFSRLQLQYDLDVIKEKEGKEVKKIHRLKTIKQ